MTHKKKKSELVGFNLKIQIRLSEYKTQENFAEAMLVDPSTVRRWIKYGVKDVNLIEEIADKLKINFWELLKWSSFFYSAILALFYNYNKL